MSRPVEPIAARVLALAGGLAFAASLLTGLAMYVAAFGAAPGPWSAGDAARAIGIDTALFTAFALHHSLFARLRLKEAVGRLVSPALERSVYVWMASLLFLALIVYWAPVPGTAWRLGGPAALLFYGVQIVGVLLTGYASAQLGVLDLSGIRQAFGRERAPRASLTSRGAYGLVRHPIYFAWLLMVWPAPVMTGSRLLFAGLTTIYLVIAVPFEERSLRRDFGEPYAAYARQVRWRMLPGVY